MKKEIFVSILFICTLINSALFAQRVKNIEGDASGLVGVKKMNIVFTYDDVTVGRYTEQEYITKKTDDYNKKEAGRGDKWKEAWEGDKKGRYEPNFIELLEKHTEIALGKYPSEKYTMTINTTRIEPGFNIFVTRKNAEIDIDVTITQKGGGIVAAYKMTGAPGRTFGGNDYDTGQRIEEAYAKAGKEMGQRMVKEMK
jgi:hypothetical protein